MPPIVPYDPAFHKHHGALFAVANQLRRQLTHLGRGQGTHKGPPMATRNLHRFSLSGHQHRSFRI